MVHWGTMDGAAARLVEEITRWFEAHGRELPWRERDPGSWAILVVEVMSQQTPIQRVVPTWRDWMERWPTPADLAGASPAEVIRAWGRMGYPRRALALREAARRITDEHGGVVPSSEDHLLDLPGVGPYTAAATRAFAHGERAVVLDTNIRRVLTRVVDGAALPPAHTRAAERARAEEVLPSERGASVLWNAAVMELGALVCTARAPVCERCPVTSCAWREAGYPDNAPVRRPQQWVGSDRQVRGTLMAQLRAHPGPLTYAHLSSCVLGAHPETEASQLERALEGLLADALVEESGAGYRLPGAGAYTDVCG